MIDRAQDRVRRVVAVGARLADRADPLGIEARAALLETAGLSREGVDLALSEHLEVDPSPLDLAALCAAMDRAPRCHVVLAANVCTAALRAIACAAAVAPIVFVRPSRRDPVLSEILARELSADAGFRAAGGSIARVSEIAPAAGDEVHAYGSDEAMAAIAHAAPPGAIVREHGTGLGIAAVGAASNLDQAASAIARDVVAFDQRGCLSPRAVLVEGEPARAQDLFAALDRALTDLGARVPRGPIDEDTAAAITRYRSTMDAVGACRADMDHVVGLDLEPRALVLPPAARVVHVVHATAEGARSLVAPWSDHITCVGGDEGVLARTIRDMAPRARRARLGEMQRPPLDGPVDLRRRSAGASGVS